MAGQAVIPVLVSAREGILDRDKYASARGAELDAFEPEVQPVTAAA